MSSTAAPYNLTIDRGSDWSKVLTLRDLAGDPVAITDIFTTAISITGTTSPSVAAASLTYVSADLWTSDGNATAPGSGTWIRVRRSAGAWEITRWVNGVQATGYWTSSSNPNHPAWVETWVAAAGATGSPVVDSAGMFFEGSISLQERGPDVIPFSFDTVGDGSAGQVEISLSRSYTRALASAGAYRFDWFVYRGRERVRLVAGRITAQGSSTGTSTGIPVPAFGSSPSIAWGSITGTLSDQTDLQAALDSLSGGGSNSITSATTSDGTADLLLSNVETATAEVTSTLIAPHIHGNLAGSVYAHVRAGEALEKGDPVYISSSHGSGATLIAEVSKADASNAAKMPAVGIMDADVALHANGHMVIVGIITELDTAGLAINAELYVASGGGMTATPPTARAQPVARVERANTNNGAILVKVNGLSASDATANTLVRRTNDGGASFAALNATELAAGGSIFQASSLGNVSFGSGSTVNFNGTTYNYAIGGAASLAHRTALGSGATGDALFQATTPAAARTTLELGDAVIRKITTADVSRNNTGTGATYTDDATLQSFAVDANSWYLVEFALMFTCTINSGIKTQLSHPALATSSAFSGRVFSPSTPTDAVANSATVTTLHSVTASRTVAPISGYCRIRIGASGGNIALQWAQNAASADNTTLLAGSLMTVTKI